MSDESTRREVADAMRQINRAWLDGRVQDLAPMLHPEVVMVFPGFTGRGEGRDDLLAGFEDFCRNATVHEFRESDHQIDVAGGTAVVTFRYEMVYERSAKRYHSTGRDLWVLQKQGAGWLATWRTMLDVQEDPV